MHTKKTISLVLRHDSLTTTSRASKNDRTDRAMNDAVEPEETMKGAGTKDELLVQRVVSTHWDRQHLDQVERAYAHRFKISGGLLGWVGGEVSSNCTQLMLACLAYGLCAMD